MIVDGFCCWLFVILLKMVGLGWRRGGGGTRLLTFRAGGSAGVCWSPSAPWRAQGHVGSLASGNGGIYNSGDVRVGGECKNAYVFMLMLTS
jgi:hypothetical protein